MPEYDLVFAKVETRMGRIRVQADSKADAMDQLYAGSPALIETKEGVVWDAGPAAEAEIEFVSCEPVADPTTQPS